MIDGGYGRIFSTIGLSLLGERDLNLNLTYPSKGEVEVRFEMEAEEQEEDLEFKIELEKIGEGELSLEEMGVTQEEFNNPSEESLRKIGQAMAGFMDKFIDKEEQGE